VEIYFKSVGRGSCLNLNLPPDRRGLIHENDIQSLQVFRHHLDATFAVNLAEKARFTVSNTRGKAAQFSPKQTVDGNLKTYWSTDDTVTNPELVLEMDAPATFNVISLREYLPLGQRIEQFAVDCWQNGGWQEIAQGSSIGNRRLLRCSKVTTPKVRLRIVKAPVCPALAELGLYQEPEW
jgi:alpha-L-fucosidase